ncbi:hypothetical protein BGZ65_006982, partial [Modicella reniformis]
CRKSSFLYTIGTFTNNSKLRLKPCGLKLSLQLEWLQLHPKLKYNHIKSKSKHKHKHKHKHGIRSSINININIIIIIIIIISSNTINNNNICSININININNGDAVQYPDSLILHSHGLAIRRLSSFISIWLLSGPANGCTRALINLNDALLTTGHDKCV